MLDPTRARAEADAAERRGTGSLWATGLVEWDNVSMGVVAQPEVVPVVEDADAGPSHEQMREAPRVAVVLRGEQRQVVRSQQEPSSAMLAEILAKLEAMAPTNEALPGWLLEAIGNPLTYDAPGPHRKDVCARVDPALYRRLQAMEKRIGLRTTAGAWEYVLRVGLAVGERAAPVEAGTGRDRALASAPRERADREQAPNLSMTSKEISSKSGGVNAPLAERSTLNSPGQPETERN